MTIEVLVRPSYLKLIPVTAGDQETIGHLHPAEYLGTLRIAKPRSVKQNAFYWKILGIVCENNEHCSRPEALHRWLKDRLGYYKEVEFFDGRRIKIFDSTGFSVMPPDKFKTFVDAALDILVTEVIPGLKRRDLVNEVESMLGYSYNSLWMPEEIAQHA